MKTFYFLCLTLLFLSLNGCDRERSQSYYKEEPYCVIELDQMNKLKVKILVIDECQYLLYTDKSGSTELEHKGNCNNLEHTVPDFKQELN